MLAASLISLEAVQMCLKPSTLAGILPVLPTAPLPPSKKGAHNVSHIAAGRLAITLLPLLLRANCLCPQSLARVAQTNGPFSACAAPPPECAAHACRRIRSAAATHSGCLKRQGGHTRGTRAAITRASLSELNGAPRLTQRAFLITLREAVRALVLRREQTPQRYARRSVYPGAATPCTRRKHRVPATTQYHLSAMRCPSPVRLRRRLRAPVALASQQRRTAQRPTRHAALCRRGPRLVPR